MKTLKITLTALFITLTCNFSKASIPNIHERLTMRYAISAYVDAFAHGRSDGLAEVIDDSAKFSQMRGQKVISFSKNEIMESLKSQQNVEQNCTTITKIVENTKSLVVYKVQMKYQNFSRISYVTMTDTGNGWKITNVSSVFS
jgi:hypothetical protein